MIDRLPRRAFARPRARSRVDLGPAAALAVVGLLTGCPPGSGDDESTTGTDTDSVAEGAVCERYVGCLGVADPKAQAAADAHYGAAGSCWGEALDQQRACVDACAGGLADAHAAHGSLAACEPPADGDDAVLELGVAVFDPDDPIAPPTFGTLTPGGPFAMVRGGQGLLMFPLALRGANFAIAADPLDYDDPKMPQVDLWMNIDGFNVGFADHFARVYNYPIPFKVVDAETVQFLYIAIIVPDAISDPMALNGQMGHVWLELQPYGEASIVREFDVLIVVDDVV